VKGEQANGKGLYIKGEHNNMESFVRH